MDDERDILNDLPRDSSPPKAYHDRVPDWPAWARGHSSWGGGQLVTPFYITRLDGHDYTVSQTVDWNRVLADPPRLIAQIDLHRLRRLDEDEDYAWEWTTLAVFEQAEAFAAGRMAGALADARRRLPEILASLPPAPDPE